MEKKVDFKTDLNERERRRFSKQMRDIATLAGETADALEAGDDKKFVMSFFGYSIHQLGLDELRNIMTETAAKKSSKEEKTDVFPEIIE